MSRNGPNKNHIQRFLRSCSGHFTRSPTKRPPKGLIGCSFSSSSKRCSSIWQRARGCKNLSQHIFTTSMVFTYLSIFITSPAYHRWTPQHSAVSFYGWHWLPIDTFPIFFAIIHHHKRHLFHHQKLTIHLYIKRIVICPRLPAPTSHHQPPCVAPPSPLASGPQTCTSRFWFRNKPITWKYGVLLSWSSVGICFCFFFFWSFVVRYTMICPHINGQFSTETKTSAIGWSTNLAVELFVWFSHLWTTTTF